MFYSFEIWPKIKTSFFLVSHWRRLAKTRQHQDQMKVDQLMLLFSDFNGSTVWLIINLAIGLRTDTIRGCIKDPRNKPWKSKDWNHYIVTNRNQEFNPSSVGIVLLTYHETDYYCCYFVERCFRCVGKFYYLLQEMRIFPGSIQASELQVTFSIIAKRRKKTCEPNRNYFWKSARMQKRQRTRTWNHSGRKSNQTHTRQSACSLASMKKLIS